MTGLFSGNYTIQIHDISSGCSVSARIEIFAGTFFFLWGFLFILGCLIFTLDPPPFFPIKAIDIQITFASTPVSCVGRSDGTLTVSASGGMAPYSFNNSASGLSPVILSAYTFTDLKPTIFPNVSVMTMCV